MEDLEDALQELTTNLMNRLQSGVPIPDEERNAIAQTINQIADEIERIQAETSLTPNLPIGTDLLWILSNGNPEAFSNYLRTFPGAGLAELANNPTAFQQAVQQLQQNNPIEEPRADAQGITPPDYHSSNVLGTRYDPRSGKLLVKYFGEDKPDSTYLYDGVPPQVATAIQKGAATAKTKGQNSRGAWWTGKNPSVGAAANQYLKSAGFQYQRVA